jgi:glycosyltransferase involved in cell wall biosynthesis
MAAKKTIAILGTRGIPACHGGFETFAERLALHLSEQGWIVTVYCQGTREMSKPVHDTWRGIRRITYPVSRDGAAATLEFDWTCVRDVVKNPPGVALTLGYNTAIFCIWMRLCGVKNIINMDGLEWRRDKWRKHERAWLWLNERIGCWVGDHLIADHPAIADHLSTRVSRSKITTITYGADHVEKADQARLTDLSLAADKYAIFIGRPEPENSVMEVVQAFSRKRRDAKLVVLGNYQPERRPYHRDVMQAASDEVIFPGAIYDTEMIRSLRYHARFYLHGHRVGGTNPSLVEAMGAGSAIIAHDNPFNRWVAGAGSRYFASTNQCEDHIEDLLQDDSAVAKMRTDSRERFESTFQWSGVLNEYETLLARYCVKQEEPMALTPEERL